VGRTCVRVDAKSTSQIVRSLLARSQFAREHFCVRSPTLKGLYSIHPVGALARARAVLYVPRSQRDGEVAPSPGKSPAVSREAPSYTADGAAFLRRVSRQLSIACLTFRRGAEATIL
jgi:hypothetical protein